MAKELPYFQFEPAEYLTGDISFCSLSAQGLFTILCSYYWQRSCKITKEQFLRRINNPDEFQELVDENVIKLDGSNIEIKFLDDQLKKVTKQSKTNSVNGSKGGRPKKEKPNETENKPKKNPNESETKGIREDKIKEDDIREENKRETDFNIFWQTYPNKTNKKGCFNKFIKLKDKDVIKILETINDFVNYKPFTSYNHPNPMTYLNQERWNDEIKKEQVFNLGNMKVIGKTNQA